MHVKHLPTHLIYACRSNRVFASLIVCRSVCLGRQALVLSHHCWPASDPLRYAYGACGAHAGLPGPEQAGASRGHEEGCRPM